MSNNQQPEYQSRPQKKQKFQKVEQPEVEAGFDNGKPYAYLGEGEIWANEAFMKILQKKYSANGEPAYSPVRHMSPGHAVSEPAYPPALYARIYQISILVHS
ncbi:hypothetical protein ACTXT7_011662 [Hymenolepis weldensis]